MSQISKGGELSVSKSYGACSDPTSAGKIDERSSATTLRSEISDHDNGTYHEDPYPVDWESWLVPEALSEDPSVFPKRFDA